MSWVITGTQKVAEKDPFLPNVSLLLHGNGINGSTTITDSSPSPKTITVDGNTNISTAQSKFGGASIAFDGAGDVLRTPNTSSFQLELGGDFTIETWIRLNQVNIEQGIITTRLSTNGFFLRVNTNNTLTFAFTEVLASVTSSSATCSINTWHHVAVTRSSNSFLVFLDGQSSAPSINSTNGTLGGEVVVGRVDVSTGFLNGYIDDLRITKGVARYTANFTPPAFAFSDI